MNKRKNIRKKQIKQEEFSNAPWKIGARDINLLLKLEREPKKQVARELGMTIGALNGWLHRIRQRRRRYRWYVNNILAIEKRSEYIKRMLMPARFEKIEEEEEEWAEYGTQMGL